MKRILEIDSKTEPALIAIFDAALRQAGWQVKANIDVITNSVQQVENAQEEKRS